MRALVLVNPRTKFEVPTFTCCKDMKGFKVVGNLLSNG